MFERVIKKFLITHTYGVIMENQLQPVDNTVEAEVVPTSEEGKKTVLVLNDSHEYEVTPTSANNVKELMNELNINSEMVVARVDGSDVIDFSGTEINEGNVYSFFTRNKTGG